MTKRLLCIPLLLLLLICTSCAAITLGTGTASTSSAPETTPPETTPTETTPTVTTPPETTPAVTTPILPREPLCVIEEGKSDFVIVIPSRADSGRLSGILASLRALSPGIRPISDQGAESEKEILLGATVRPETAEARARLAETASEEHFQYLIAEIGGKLILYAECDEGYGFIFDYFKAKYVIDGSVTVERGLFDVQSMTWQAYSDYLDRLAAEEAARIEAERLAKIERLRAENAAFSSSDFGSITKLSQKYDAPPAYPDEAHPRILVTPRSLETVRAGFTHPENQAQYHTYLEMSDYKTDGRLVDVSIGHNVDYNVLAAIEAKAFRYLMTGDEAYGYEAIVAIKNYILTLEIYEMSDACRAYGYVMYIAACVYDWCYDLLDESDRIQIVSGVESKLARHLEVGYPPSGQGAVTGHGSEAQILRDWLAFGIAVYGDYSDVYRFVAGRVFDQFTEAPDYFLDSGAYWQGSAYGPYRYHFLLFAQLLIDRMTNGEVQFLDSRLAEPALTFLYYRRPDGQNFRDGDDYCEGGYVYSNSSIAIDAFYAASLYGNSVLKGYAYTALRGFSANSISANNALSSVMHLCANDTSLSRSDPEALPLVRELGAPLGAIFARSAWNDEDAVAVYMKIGVSYSANHEHKDAGHFQIFYRGILASDSGRYDLYGTTHDYAYHKQTVAHNCLLIYNPSKKSSGKWIYSGGQSIHKSGVNGENATLAQWLAKSQSKQAYLLGLASATETSQGEERYLWSYIAGNLTNAYDSDTVDEVSRYMLSVMTDDPENPMVFFVFDRVTAVNASYKKTFLLHTQREPSIDGATARLYGKGGGMLCVQSVGTAVTYTAIGGEGKECMVNGVNYPAYGSEEAAKQQMAGTNVEYGWGRVEISPKTASKTDRLLTVMYVTDRNDAEMIRADGIDGEKVLGAVILGKAAVFPKSAGGHTSAFSFTSPGEGELEYFVASLAAGTWSVSVDGGDAFTVIADSDGMTAFTAPAGKVTLTPVK